MQVNYEVERMKNIMAAKEYITRKKFWHLFESKNAYDIHFLYKRGNIALSCIKYLNRCFILDFLTIGFELEQVMRNVLIKIKTKFINFCIHSFKLYQHFLLLITRNIKNIYHHIIEENRSIKGLLQKRVLEYKNMISEKFSSILDKSVIINLTVFTEQIKKGVSIAIEDRFLLILYHKNESTEYKKQCGNIYYFSYHQPETSYSVKKSLNKLWGKYDIKVLDGYNPYYIICFNNIFLVGRLLSSTIYPAFSEEKNVHFLYKALFYISTSFAYKSFINIKKAFLEYSFWWRVFQALQNCKEGFIVSYIGTSSALKRALSFLRFAEKLPVKNIY